ncbi:MAG: hypothetical protein VW378_00380 [bacterium]
MTISVHRFLEYYHDLRFYELNVISVTLASFGACFLGTILYAWLKTFFSKPWLIFACICFGFAILDSCWVLLMYPVSGFAKLANPLHFVVSGLLVVLLPFVDRFSSKTFSKF